MNNIEQVARELVSAGKGILAADESVGTMGKRLAAINVESTLSNRSLWREIMLTAEGVENYISGVILFDETLREPTPGGYTIAELLQKKGIHPGIKVDTGVVPIPHYPGDTYTQGLDKLGDRLTEYREMGATFTKWRAVYTVSDTHPSEAALVANAVGLAQYASLAQQAGLVPIVEPEVLVLEGVHSIETSKEVTKKVLQTVFAQLKKFKVNFRGMLLKPNMVLSGKESERKVSAPEVARATVETLLEEVPQEVPGIVFLSGGLSPDDSTSYLATMNSLYADKLPWELSYSYGRALQQEALKVWGGKQSAILESQKIFLERAHKVSEARFGKII